MNDSLKKFREPASVVGCCLVCDQISVSKNANQKLLIENACPVCETDIRRFFSPTTFQYDDSVFTEAADLLKRARMPLVCGLRDQSFETQQAAIQLARKFDCVLDWTSGNWPFAFQNTLQQTGWVSCTFGEIRERADLVIAFGFNPETKHKHFFNRFVDPNTATNFATAGQSTNDLIRFLRGDSSIEVTPEYASLKQRIESSGYVVFLVDSSFSQTSGETGVLNLARYVRSENDRRHVRVVHIANQNSYGIRSACSSSCGAPFGIAFRDGKPTFRGREYSRSSLISKGCIDAILVVGGPEQVPSDLPDSVPIVHLCDSFSGEPETTPFTIGYARWGLGCDGTGIRGDGVPIHRKQIFDSSLPKPRQILSRLVELA